MPTSTKARRDRLADAGIELLAREGARGLTHRKVDAEAAEPPGTTSRYFRTREALMTGVVERVRELHFADLGRAPRTAADPAAIGEHLAAMVQTALTTNRSRHLAIAELFLESTRRPALHAAMAALRTAQIELVRDVHLAAGVELTTRQAALLVTTITGLVHIALTTPEAIGGTAPDDVREWVHRAVELVRAAPPGRQVA
jgi:DNA-binding transcriptional regulator YbjK